MKVQIRMYNAGLGDCFLLTFQPGGKETAHVLIDCGVLVGTSNAVEKMEKRVRNIAKDTGGHLNAVVATHEHWDHVSGFSQAQQVFKDDIKTIDEIWFAWTEAPADELADRLRGDRADRKQKLKSAFALWDSKVAEVRAASNPGVAADTPASEKDEVSAATARLDLTRSVLAFGDPSVMPMTDVDDETLGIKATTKDALGYLKGRPERKRYLEPGTVCEIPGLDGVRVYVLAPPRDEKLLKKGRPSAKTPETYLAENDDALSLSESFFSAIDALAAADVESALVATINATVGDATTAANPVCDPFDPYYRVEIQGAQNEAVYKDRYFGAESWRRIDNDWLGATSSLALALDNDTNNTSLVLAFELPNGDVLLFPGDAQVGNWLSWQNVTFKVGSGTAEKTVKVDDLLARTVFYKVGHHASHNATLREHGLEKMTHRGLMSMIPVEHAMAATRGWAMPFGPLYERLAEKCRGRVLRLDDVAFDEKRLAPLHDREREAFVVRFHDLFVELTIDTGAAASDT